MIANVLNFLIGLGVSYVAIFGMPSTMRSPWLIAAVGVVIVLLGQIARRSDYSGWQSATNTVLGVVLFIVTLAERLMSISPLVTFWIDLWVGLTVASLALWAILYHPKEGTNLPEIA